MRGALFWTASTVLAFAVTAGVFLMLAELATSPPGQSLSADDESRDASRGDPLNLTLSRQALESLEEAEDQSLGMRFSNGSDRKVTGINVYLVLSSEDTSEQESRYYEAEIRELAPGESKTARFELDLSPPRSEAGGAPPEKSFNILEISAVSSEGVSTIKTVVFAF